MTEIVYEDKLWVKYAIGLLYEDPKFKKLLTMDGVLLTLAIPYPSENSLQVVIGVFSQDTPSALVPVEKMKISYPGAKFIFSYPTKRYQSAIVPEQKDLDSATIERYQKLFGEPKHHSTYLKNLHRVLKKDHYNEIVSRLLGYGWLTDTGENKEIITLQVSTLAEYFDGAPTELRDFYLTEGRPFFDWMLKYL